MVEVVVGRLGLDASSKAYVVVLHEKGGERVLPIWIGQAEAESIVMEMHRIHRARPLTHDLCKSLIVGLGGTLRGVHITRVEKSTYYAELHLQQGDHVVEIDARPSDSIAIALRLNAPIFADDGLLLDVEVEEEPNPGAPLFGVDVGDDDDDEDDDDAAEAGDEGADPQSSGDARELSAEQLRRYLEKLGPEDFGKFRT